MKQLTYALNQATAVLMLALTMLFAAQSTHANDRPFGERSIFSDRAVGERISPVGKVCLEGDEGCGKTAEAGATEVAQAELTPEGIYTSKCQACHNSGMMGAPKPGGDVWQSRLDDVGLDQIVKHAIEGYNAMPAKGMCTECSDQDIRDTVEYMISYSP